MRELIDNTIRSRQGFVFVASVIFLTLLGPFGSYNVLDLPHRFAFWSLAIGSVAFPMNLSINHCLRTPRLGSTPPILRLVIGSALAAIPGTFLIFMVFALLWPSPWSSHSPIFTWVQVTTLGVAIGLFQFVEEIFGRPFRMEHATGRVTSRDDPRLAKDNTGEAVPPRLHRRLSPETGTDIVSLSMQDHYVEVTTTSGNELILMRMSDALDELGDLPGLRIHRSHWAALAHMTGLERVGGKPRVTLSDGRSLPVSQTYLAAVRKALS